MTKECMNSECMNSECIRDSVTLKEPCELVWFGSGSYGYIVGFYLCFHCKMIINDLKGRINND